VNVALASLAVVLVSAAAAPVPQGDDGARLAAASFGRALVSGKADALRAVLPDKGKVRLTLLIMGPEDGAFGASQVEALFREFLAGGKVRSFVVTRCESDGHTGALAHAKASIVDHEGRTAEIGMHLWLEPEGNRWVLREVKESAG
jgi:hypothetical protein